uniref:Uncharacterized protein n=1 Tax=Rhizophagus irregularis (strain DAOM 181602 / DAOM 197198 / MUCL 43194) TaxID=747089 RepID=U9SZX0_RHIID
MPVILQNLLLSLTLFIWDIGVRKISCGRIVSYGVIVINVFNECSRSRSDICNGRKNGSTVADVYTNCSLYNFYIVQLKQYSGHRNRFLDHKERPTVSRVSFTSLCFESMRLQLFSFFFKCYFVNGTVWVLGWNT